MSTSSVVVVYATHKLKPLYILNGHKLLIRIMSIMENGGYYHVKLPSWLHIQSLSMHFCIAKLIISTQSISAMNVSAHFMSCIYNQVKRNSASKYSRANRSSISFFIHVVYTSRVKGIIKECLINN